MPDQAHTAHVRFLRSLIRPYRYLKPHAFFNALRHPSWHWIVFSLAVIFYALTVIYASHPEILSRHAWVGGSPAHAVLILSVLSGIANPMLAATMGHSLDTLRDALVARDQGHYLVDNQILQAGTGIEALFATTTMIGRHVPRKRTRVWSLFRLLCMIVVPALSIIIFSMIFSRLRLSQSCLRSDFCCCVIKIPNIRYVSFSLLIS